MKEKKVAEIFRENRWARDVICVYCSSQDIVKNGERDDGIQQYRCKSCDKSFNDRSKTIFSKTDMSLKECFKIINMAENGQNISNISKETERSWMTVKRFLRRLKCDFDPLKVASEVKNQASLDIDYSKVGCGNNPDIS